MNATMVLLEERDPVIRSRAHLLLGRRALAAQELARAAEHLKEALDLDPTDEAPRLLLAEIAASQDRGRFHGRWWPFS